MIQFNSCQILTFLSYKLLEYNDRVVSEIILDNGVRVMNTSRVDRVMNVFSHLELTKFGMFIRIELLLCLSRASISEHNRSRQDLSQKKRPNPQNVL